MLKITASFGRCAHLISLRHMFTFLYPEISRQGREEMKREEARLGLKNLFLLLLKTSSTGKAEGQDSASNNILTQVTS